MKIIECEQNTTAWEMARLGRVTASEIDALISPTGKIRTGKGVETYLYKKVCEKLLNYSPDFGGTFATDQGALIEKIAIPYYDFTYDTQIKRVGFCESDDGFTGCSPDGLIGEDGGIEIKCFQPAHSLRCLMENAIPDEYLMQIHFSMYVTGRPWWKFLSFSRQFPNLVLTVERDEKIQDTIRAAIHIFRQDFARTLGKLELLKSE